MTVKELKDKIKDLPDNMDVMLDVWNEEGQYQLAETAEVKPIVFKADGIPKKEWATEECLVISDQ